jgi:hypothetical protein
MKNSLVVELQISRRINEVITILALKNSKNIKISHNQIVSNLSDSEVGRGFIICFP